MGQMINNSLHDVRTSVDTKIPLMNRRINSRISCFRIKITAYFAVIFVAGAGIEY
jgi:hypothetical protein